MIAKIESILTLICAAMGSIFTCLAAAIPTPTELTDAIQSALLDDARMRLVCIAGSLGGAVLSVAIFPPKAMQTARAAIQTVAIKLVSSTIAAIIFTPLVMRWFGFSRNSDTVLASAAGVALCSIGLIKILVPAVTKFIVKKLGGQEEERPLLPPTTVEPKETTPLGK